MDSCSRYSDGSVRFSSILHGSPIFLFGIALPEWQAGAHQKSRSHGQPLASPSLFCFHTVYVTSLNIHTISHI
jgi:hypothetical protein